MERASYRPNLNFGVARISGFVAASNKYARTVYAERNTGDNARGLYGGDAYPAVWEQKSDDGRMLYGLIIAADGVGQGAFTHPTLINRLSSIPDERDKLIFFLQKLFGKRCLQDEEFLQYALRCFSDIPTGGYFLSDGERQQVLPFYMRDSQSLGSRLACLYIYKNFRKFALEGGLSEWDEGSATKLSRKISAGFEEDLMPKLGEFFSPDDAPSATKREICFLPSTVACWFYIATLDEKKSKRGECFVTKLDALSLTCGDARTYRADPIEGVQQISVDDTGADGDSMNAIVHFAPIARREENGVMHYDRLFRARRILVDDERRFPCMLFACSDGVYDTCPEYKDGTHSFGSPNGDSSDFLFECNMLKALRACYSLDDFERQVAYKFYGQDSPAHGEWRDSGKYTHIKKDDSATLAMRVFSRDPNALFDRLREKKTKLDELVERIESNGLPIENPYIEDLSERRNQAISAYRSTFLDATKAELSEILKAVLQNAEDKTTGVWGISRYPTESELNFRIGYYYKFFSLVILNTVISEWEKLRNLSKAEQKEAFDERGKHPDKYVVSSAKIFKLLKDAGFDEFYDSLLAIKHTDEELDVQAKYEVFLKCFYGDDHSDRGAVTLVGGRDIDKPFDDYNA